MSFTLIASACPPIQVGPSTFYSRALSFASSAGLSPSSRGIPSGSTNWPQLMNENATVSDNDMIYGGGSVRAVCQIPGSTPLLITALGGNLISVAAGHARIDGLVELAAIATGIAVSTGWNYVWLKQNANGVGVVQVVTGSTAAPTTKSCYLGGINITAGTGTPDYSGVMYTVGGGDPYRVTNDTETPSDTPPTGICIRTRTQQGLFLWDGMKPGGGEWIGPMGSVNGGSF